jgi:hypothetical protein
MIGFSARLLLLCSKDYSVQTANRTRLIDNALP